MKKLLAVLLAALMLCGCMAIGVSALTDEQEKEIGAIKSAVRLEMYLELLDGNPNHYALAMAQDFLDDSFLKPGNTWDAFSDAMDAYMNGEAREAFLKFDSEAAFLAGTLESDFRKIQKDMFAAYDEVVLVARNAMKAEVMDAFLPIGNCQLFGDILFEMQNAGIITEAKRSDVRSKMNDILAEFNFTDWLALLVGGEYAQAKTQAQELCDAIYALFVEEGILTPPEPPCPDCGKFPCECKPAKPTLPGTNREATFFNWILYILAFGWIWMRFFG